MRGYHEWAKRGSLSEDENVCYHCTEGKGASGSVEALVAYQWYLISLMRDVHSFLPNGSLEGTRSGEIAPSAIHEQVIPPKSPIENSKLSGSKMSRLNIYPRSEPQDYLSQRNDPRSHGLVVLKH